MKNARKTLIDLGLSDAEVKTYLCLVENGALSASDLVRQTQTKRPTVYYALRQLIERGLVAKTGTPGVERFQASPAEGLLDLLEQRKHALEDLQKQTEALIPTLISNTHPREGLPSISFYEGERAMKQAISESLYCRHRAIDYLTPHDNFFWQTEDQVWADAYILDRKRRDIKTRHLWERLLEPQVMKDFSFPLERIRILPKDMWGKFGTMVMLFDDKVMYVSSKKSGYVLVVRSQEHHDLLGSMFEVLWTISLPAAQALEQAHIERKQKNTEP